MSEPRRQTAQGLVFGVGWGFALAYLLHLSLNPLQLAILFLLCSEVAFIGLRRKSEHRDGSANTI